MPIHEFDEHLRAARELSAAYARLPKPQVPAALDRAVLARAAAAIGQTRRPVAQHLAPVALAASVLLALATTIYLVRHSASPAPARDVPHIVPARATAADRLLPRREAAPAPTAAAPEAAEPPLELVPPILHRGRVISSDPPGSRPFDLGVANAAVTYEAKPAPGDSVPPAALADLARLEALRREGRDAEAAAAEQAFRDAYPHLTLTRR
jgi:hypothetical protein